MRYMLDTHVCDYIMRRRPAEVLGRLEGLHPGEAIMLAVRARKRSALDRAAHARSIGAMVVTNNEGDFKDYPGLAVENRALMHAPSDPI